ncbi:MAG: DUF368 domain-containing protein [Bacteroidota bacterium]|nr:DUF368 domain-containing protein [Bacteroidota bacterium]
MKELINIFIKGFGIGAANVIPGVSGGTIALITGIFERLINSIKSFNIKALKLLLAGEFKKFVEHTDFFFLITLFFGALASVFTLARVLDFLFAEYFLYVWSYFFGLILASVLFVGRKVDKYSFPVIISFVIGTSFAVALSFINPATENAGFFYLVLCGIAGIVSMILPGLSGSFILILMGNYQLVMIDAVNHLDYKILLPVALGIILGLLIFSRILSYLYKKYRNLTIATLAGFILGSLSVLWPWKKEVYMQENGVTIMKSNGEPIIESYDKYIPTSIDNEVLTALAIMLIGILTIWGIEFISAKLNISKKRRTV